MTAPPTIIVIGASVGGVEAIRALVAELPADLRAAVFVTLHIGAYPSDLPWLLTRAGALPAQHPVDGEAFVDGRIYVAPPDHHMVVDASHIRLTKGPRENWARPAIDPLFRSAARAHGAGVIGVILTGGLNDGTAGMIEVKARGGITIVQDPIEAVTPDMPQSIVDNVEVDHLVSVNEIGALLARLVRQASAGAERTKDEQLETGMIAEFTLDKPIAITCPDCGGALKRSQLGTLTQFSCHIGHVYTAEVMVAVQFTAMQRSIEAALRSVGERADLCRQMAARLPDRPESIAARADWHAAVAEAVDRTEPLRQVLTAPWRQPSPANNGRDTSLLRA